MSQYFNDAIWKKDQTNKAAGQKWRHEETNHMYINEGSCQDLLKMFNWTCKTRVKFKWPGLLNRICTISGITEFVYFLCIPLSVCFLIVYLQTPTPVIRSCWTSSREFYFPTWEKSLSTITMQFLYTLFLTSASPYELQPADNFNVSVTKGLKAARGNTALLFLDGFGVNEEGAEILQVETKDRKSTEWICVALLKISKKYCFLMVNLQIQGEGKKKKVSFQQEMKVKTTEINSLTFEMGKNKHIVIDVQRDRVNRQ